MSELKVGDYVINYRDDELKGNHPKDIFFDFLQDTPVIVQENFLSPEEIEILYSGALKRFDKRTYATVHDYTGGVEAYRVDTSGRYTHYIQCEHDVYQLLEKKLSDAIYPALKNHYSVGDKKFRRSEGWQILGYGEDYFFRPHADNCVAGSRSGDPEFKNIPWFCNTPNRKFTVLLYLNDQDDNYPGPGKFSGGEFCVTRVIKDGKQLTIKPKAGTLVAMPANFFFMHEVKKVTKGYRFSAVTWVDVE